LRTATEYHDLTSYRRDRMSGHYMDLGNQPDVFKRYPGIEPIPLPGDAELPTPRLSSLLRKGDRPGSPTHLGIDDLSRIFILAYSLTARAGHGSGDFFFRNAASAGALYPTEMYASACGIEGLEDGLYHFSIADQGLSPLRKGTAKPARSPALTFYLTAIFFRSAWKYRDRSYRYHLLDTGHVIENLTLALKAMNLPFSLAYDFDDKTVNAFLGLDEVREATLAVCRMPGGIVADDPGLPGSFGNLPDNCTAASRVSARETAYPPILDIHDAGARILPAKGTPADMAAELGIDPENRDPIDARRRWPETMTCPEALSQRRSSRNFIPQPISGDAAAAFMHGLCIEDSTPSEPVAGLRHCLGTGLLVGGVDGMAPGLYLLDPASLSSGLAVAGLFMDRMADICLNQGWLKNAGVHVLFMANLALIDRYWGARGYRYAMLNAGRLGQRLYLQATAMGLGCCGIGALYDEEAADLLGLNPTSRLLYLVGIGGVKGKI